VEVTVELYHQLLRKHMQLPGQESSVCERLLRYLPYPLYMLLPCSDCLPMAHGVPPTYTL